MQKCHGTSKHAYHEAHVGYVPTGASVTKAQWADDASGTLNPLKKCTQCNRKDYFELATNPIACGSVCDYPRRSNYEICPFHEYVTDLGVDYYMSQSMANVAAVEWYFRNACEDLPAWSEW